MLCITKKTTPFSQILKFMFFHHKSSMNMGIHIVVFRVCKDHHWSHFHKKRSKIRLNGKLFEKLSKWGNELCNSLIGFFSVTDAQCNVGLIGERHSQRAAYQIWPKLIWAAKDVSRPVWPDLAIYWTLGNFKSFWQQLICPNLPHS